MKTLPTRRLSLALAAAFIAGGCAPSEEPGAAPAPTPEPAPPKLTAVAFAAPIMDGKSEAWNKFIADTKGDRAEEWGQARAAAGLTREMVWHQASPAGEFAVVYQEGPDLATVMQRFAASETPIDKEFVAMLGDVHGMDPSQPMPAGELLIDYTGEGGPNPAYGFLVPVVEGKESLAIEFVKGHGGAGAEAFAASRARIGVNRERVWVYGGGKMLLVVWESAELDQVMPRWVASEDPGDAAFLESVKEFSGIDFRATDPSPPNELVLDWTASE